MKEKLQKRTGITLIALVITIVVLLILSSVTITTLIGDHGILTQARNAKQTSAEAELDEKILLDEIANFMEGRSISRDGFNKKEGVNEPKLAYGMIPVKWQNGKWVKADEENKNNDWYQYGTTKDTKKWANVVTVKETGTKTRKEYIDATTGTQINMEDITTMFVWIPRYSYKIAGTKNIEINFLQGNTNYDANGQEYSIDSDTSKTAMVHPGFTMQNAELTGIWVAKFEASGTNQDGKYVGNATKDSSAQQYTPDSSTYVQIKPSAISWRHITIGESEYQSMKMSQDDSHYGFGNVNSHLIKNNEWGAVAYLCYSKYGTVPKINGSGSTKSNSHWYNMYTGAGPNSRN